MTKPRLSALALTIGAMTLGLMTSACAQDAVPPKSEAHSNEMPAFSDLQDTFETTGLEIGKSFDLAMEVIAQTGRSFDMGEGANGRRRLVEITGGAFQATGPDGQSVSGVVLPGGTDRQLFRSDGIRELDARYELQADDGSLFFVHNKVIIDSARPAEQGRYARSVITVEAPQGEHDWINRRLLIGTLDSLRPEQPYVYLRFYAVK